MSGYVVKWFGSRALLVEAGAFSQAQALHASLAAKPVYGQLDLVLATTTLLVICDSHYSATQALQRLAASSSGASAQVSGRLVELEVIYDGADLDTVAQLTGLGVAGVINAHTGQAWQAAFSGFAPGFVYLQAADSRLEVPRRNTPRVEVPAGSVALAGGFGAVYPHASPGGWQLIGRTNAVLWDIERDPPALIQPGDRVRYVAVDYFSADTAKSARVKVPGAATHGVTQVVTGVSPSISSETFAGAAPMMPLDDSSRRVPNVALAEGQNDACGAADGAVFETSLEVSLEVIRPGMQSLIEDLGRPGLSHLGVSASGVADEVGARQVNRQLGNAATAAVIETLLGGLCIKAHGDCLLARGGAVGEAIIAGQGGERPAPHAAAFLLYDGETLTVKAPTQGLRSYIGVAGGIAVAKVLGSRSTDTLSGLGPAPLATGQRLPVGVLRGIQPVGHQEAVQQLPLPAGVTQLRLVLGPNDDWFDATAIKHLLDQSWQVTPQSNRIGLRLAPINNADAGVDPSTPAGITRQRQGEMDTAGMVSGALQVPPSGMPVLFLKDHGITGGYPVIATLVHEDLSLAAQLPPGAVVSFVVVSARQPATA